MKLGLAPNKGGVYAVEYVSDDEFWVKVAVADLGVSGAIAYQFIKDDGGSGATDTGSPWDAWRRVGIYGLPSVESPHDDNVNRVIIASEFDLGARDYAFYSNAESKWVMSFHGGETTSELHIPDVSTSGEQRGTFRLTRSSVGVTGAAQVDAEFECQILPNGIFRDAMSFVSSDQVWSEVLVSHEILSNASQYSTDGGETFEQIVVNDKITVDSGVILRNPTSGIQAQITCDAHEQSNFMRYYVRQHTGQSRIKFYAEFDPATSSPLSIATVNRQTKFWRTDPDPTPPLNYVAEDDGLSGVTIHAGTASIDTATTPDTLLLNGDGTGAPFNRVSLILGISEPGDYRLLFGDVSLAGNPNGGTDVFITKATNGSNVTPTPIATGFMGNVVSSGSFDFTISDVSGDPVRLLLRQARAAASADRCRIGSIFLQKLPL
ncbi:hypothetical protein D4A92_19620 [Rhizobium rosettiformans]|uniref:Exo-alpha-sialidase n=2 Tax=Rhizobium rosettiformans TaxID=1368430 RepID=A0ABX7F2B6_9HYPH|nr:hypothetical protein D4A92_19620 [Rhizobium rosettiformans]